MDSFECFTIPKAGFPYTDGNLFVRDGETPPKIIGEKLSLKELFAKFHALTDLRVEIGVKLENFIFANHERARLNMEKQKKQAEEISKKHDFFDDKDD